MRRSVLAGASVLAACAVLVAACGGQEEPAADASSSAPAAVDVPASSDISAPSAAEPTPTTPGDEADDSETDVAPAVQDPRAVDCVPGTWDVDMPSFIATFQTPGKPKYRDGTYTFTFDATNGFSAVGDDVTFRLRNSDGFVDVHNSWTEDGLWAAANDTSTFDEALVVLGYPGDVSAAEMAVTLGTDEENLVAVVGGGYSQVEAFGMVNGSIRTPPLSDEGAAITGIGDVDCAAGTMTLYVADAGWKGWADLTRR